VVRDWEWDLRRGLVTCEGFELIGRWYVYLTAALLRRRTAGMLANLMLGRVGTVGVD